jgi:hypothetical protein
MECHIRALWKLVEQTAVPPPVSEDDLQTYANRYTSVKDIRQAVTTILDKHADQINLSYVEAHQFQVLLANLNPTGSIARLLSLIPETVLIFMYQHVAAMGLKRWNPDPLNSDPDSMYNALHEEIALHTFEHACFHAGYQTCVVDKALARDHVWARQIYRNFVFHYMARKAKVELRKPGRVAEIAEMNPIYKRRVHVRALTEIFI